MKRISLMFAVLAIGFGPTSLYAQQGRPEGVTDAMIQEGETIYMGAGLCAACHGMDATGAIGPDLTDAEWLTGGGPTRSSSSRSPRACPWKRSRTPWVPSCRPGAGLPSRTIR